MKWSQPRSTKGVKPSKTTRINISPSSVGVRAPSFRGFCPASEVSSRAKQANPSADTKPELLLRSALSALGLRFRRNQRSILGKPDFVFSKERVLVFCDGDFWHGRNWTRLRLLLARRANAAYWIPKIRANRRRDTQTQRALERDGWRVVRVWEGDVRKNALRAATQVQLVVAQASKLP